MWCCAEAAWTRRRWPTAGCRTGSWLGAAASWVSRRPRYARPGDARMAPHHGTQGLMSSWDRSSWGRSRWMRGQDLNLRPSGYEPDELPGCSTPRRWWDGRAAGGPCGPPVPGGSLIASVKLVGDRHRRAHGSLRGRPPGPPHHGLGWVWVDQCGVRRRPHAAGRHTRGSASTLALVPAGTNSSGRRQPGDFGQATAGLLPVQRNSVASRHMRWRTMASFRATATFAFLNPERRAMPRPHSRNADGRRIRVRSTLAAS
jgi:hypothetical protein